MGTEFESRKCVVWSRPCSQWTTTSTCVRGHSRSHVRRQEATTVIIADGREMPPPVRLGALQVSPPACARTFYAWLDWRGSTCARFHLACGLWPTWCTRPRAEVCIWQCCLCQKMRKGGFAFAIPRKHEEMDEGREQCATEHETLPTTKLLVSLVHGQEVFLGIVLAQASSATSLQTFSSLASGEAKDRSRTVF